MQSLSIKEAILAVVVIILALLLLNPFRFFMPTMLHMTVLGILLVASALLVGLVVHERIYDEREAEHRNHAGRVSYLLGLVAVVVGIAVQTIAHQPVDPWLVIALLVMVVGKITARAYSRRYR